MAGFYPKKKQRKNRPIIGRFGHFYNFLPFLDRSENWYLILDINKNQSYFNQFGGKNENFFYIKKIKIKKGGITSQWLFNNLENDFALKIQK